MIFFVLCNSYTYAFQDSLLKKYFDLPDDKLLIKYSYILFNDIDSETFSWEFLVSKEFDNTNKLSVLIKTKDKIIVSNDKLGLYFHNNDYSISVFLTFPKDLEKTKITISIRMYINQKPPKQTQKKVLGPEEAERILKKSEKIIMDHEKEIENTNKNIETNKQTESKLKNDLSVSQLLSELQNIQMKNAKIDNDDLLFEIKILKNEIKKLENSR